MIIFEYILCGINIACHLRNLEDYTTRPKYPPDVAQLCQYFEEQKTTLPDYCKWGDEPKPPRKRNEF